MAKILLVEDDNNLREIYGERLMAEGYEIVSAKDGEEALAVAVREKPDLIISDVMMPKISGFDMLDILRQTPETKLTKVIMMTALSQSEDKERADKLGADKYLVKSQVTLEDMARVVNDVLNPNSPGTNAAQSNDGVDNNIQYQTPETGENDLASEPQSTNRNPQAIPNNPPVTPPPAPAPTVNPSAQTRTFSEPTIQPRPMSAPTNSQNPVVAQPPTTNNKPIVDTQMVTPPAPSPAPSTSPVIPPAPAPTASTTPQSATTNTDDNQNVVDNETESIQEQLNKINQQLDNFVASAQPPVNHEVELVDPNKENPAPESDNNVAEPAGSHKRVIEPINEINGSPDINELYQEELAKESDNTEYSQQQTIRPVISPEAANPPKPLQTVDLDDISGIINDDSSQKTQTSEQPVANNPVIDNTPVNPSPESASDPTQNTL